MPEPTVTVTGTATPETPAPTPEAPKLQLTQEEINAIVQDRLSRERAKTEPELTEARRKAKAFDDLEAKGKTELQLANDRAVAAEADRDKSRSEANATLRTAALLTEAASQGAASAEVVARLLRDEESVTVDKGTVKGAKEAVADLLKANPFLKKSAAAPAASGAPFNGNAAGKTLDQLIADAEKAGDYKESIRLKGLKYPSAG